jgi:hypothetical protein
MIHPVDRAQRIHLGACRAEANQTTRYQQRVQGPMPYTLLARGRAKDPVELEHLTLTVEGCDRGLVAP